jgi:hypothetical protein
MRADFTKWVGRKKWTLWQAACIVSGEEPVPGNDYSAIADDTVRKRVNDLFEKSKDDRTTAKKKGPLKHAEDSRTGWVGNKRIFPSNYVAWAQRNGFEIPLELKTLLIQSAGESNLIDWPHWKLQHEVRLWEAVLLSLDINPELEEPFDDFIEYGPEATTKAVRKRLRTLKSSLADDDFSAGTLNFGDSNLHGVRLSQFAAWCARVGYEIPVGLAAMVIPSQLKATGRTSEVMGATNDAPKPMLGLFMLAGEKVHIEHGISESSKEGTESQFSARVGLTKQQVLRVEWPFFTGKFNKDSLEEALGNVPKWMQAARITPGARGKSSATWNPVLLAVGLVERGHISKNGLAELFRNHLPSWAEDWNRTNDEYGE